MKTEIAAIQQTLPEAVEKVLMTGDLTQLKPEERVLYYNMVCKSMHLNPLTNPFAYILLNGKLTLYAKKECTDQLRNVHKISIQIVSREKMADLYIVTARAIGPDGRYDESTGVVHLARLQGDSLANAYMKAETKAKRRVTLSYSGLSMPDESEIETVKDAVKVNYDYAPTVQKTYIEATPPSQHTESTKEEAKQEIKVAEIYDGNNPDHVKKLESALRALKVEEIEWTNVEQAMQGKELRRSVIDDVCRAIFLGNEGTQD